jgi:hypothetical protein
MPEVKNSGTQKAQKNSESTERKLCFQSTHSPTKHGIHMEFFCVFCAVSVLSVFLFLFER